jgi:hypothetical protein
VNVNLLNQYNDLVSQANALGLNRYRTVQRFRPADSGPARIAQIESDIRAAQASEAAVTSEEAATPVVVVEEAAAAMVDPAEATAEEVAVVEAIQPESDTMAKSAAVKTAKTKAPKAPKVDKTKATKEASAKRGRPPTNGVTIAVKTDEFNKKVPALKKAGETWAKVHTSYFGSHTAADAQNKRADEALKRHKSA